MDPFYWRIFYGSLWITNWMDSSDFFDILFEQAFNGSPRLQTWEIKFYIKRKLIEFFFVFRVWSGQSKLNSNFPMSINHHHRTYESWIINLSIIFHRCITNQSNVEHRTSNMNPIKVHKNTIISFLLFY